MIKRKAVLGTIIIPTLLFVFGFVYSAANLENAIALSDEDSSVFSANDITFYDPTCDSQGGGGNGACCDIDTSITGVDARLEEAITQCAEAMMEMQREYGVPWEVPFIHMRAESGMGTTGLALTTEQKCKKVNWMGYKYGARALYGLSESEMTCKAYDGEGDLGAQYDSLADMIGSFYTDYLRNGAYDSAYQYATPDNFDLEKFFKAEATTYVGGGQPGSNPDFPDANYRANYPQVIDKIREISKEKGWPTSEELAKQENIPKGGRWPVNGDIKKQMNAAPHSLHACDGSTSGSSNSTGSTSSSGNSSFGTAKWKNGWLEEGSITGAIKEDVSNKSDLDQKPYKDGDYITNKGSDGKGKPNKILLHYTEGTTSGYAAYPSGNKYPAHFTIDAKKKKIVQAFPITRPSLAIHDHDQAAGVQIEIVSKGYDDYSKYTDEEWDYIAALLVAISEETGIPLTSSVKWTGSPARLSTDAFNKYEGVLGHMHAPDNDHDDPGDIWKFLEPAIKRVQGGSCNNYSGDYPEYLQGGGQPWSGLYYGGKAPKNTVAYRGCGLCSIAMLATVATGKDILPTDVYNFLGDQRYPDSSQPYSDLDVKVGKKFGFEAKNVNYSSKEQAKKDIINYMDQGYMIHLTGAGCHCGFQNGNKCSGGHFIGLAKLSSDKTKVQVLNSAYGGNSECPLDDVIAAMHNGHYGIIKGNSTGKNTCTDLCENEGDKENTGSGDILAAVEEIIALANKNGSTYSQANHSMTAFKSMLNDNAPVNQDCTGFASLVYYKAYGDAFVESDIFNSSSIYTNPSYKQVPFEDVQPGDIAARPKPSPSENGHGVIITKVENGKITQIAETGGKVGRSGKNNNIGYNNSPSKVSEANGYHIFRWNK